MAFSRLGTRNHAPGFSGIELVHRGIRKLDPDTHDAEQVQRFEQLIDVAQFKGDIGADQMALAAGVDESRLLAKLQRIAHVGALIGGVVAVRIEGCRRIVPGDGAVICDGGCAGERCGLTGFERPQHRFVIAACEYAVAGANETGHDGIVRAVAQHLPRTRPDEFFMAEVFGMRGQRLCRAVLRKQQIAMVVGGGSFTEPERCPGHRRHECLQS